MFTALARKPAVLAGNLLFAAAFLSILSFLLFRQLPTSMLSGAGWIVAYGFYLLIAYVVRQGYNGARTVLLTVVGVMVFNHFFANGFVLPQVPGPPLRSAAWLLEWLLLLGALGLLYFRSRSGPPNPTVQAPRSAGDAPVGP